MIQQCLDCKFYLINQNPHEPGLCRRFPPAAVQVTGEGGRQGTMSVFPPMTPTGWCGEFKLKIRLAS